MHIQLYHFPVLFSARFFQSDEKFSSELIELDKHNNGATDNGSTILTVKVGFTPLQFFMRNVVRCVKIENGLQ